VFKNELFDAIAEGFLIAGYYVKLLVSQEPGISSSLIGVG
jgi:hypothetical protein